VERKKILKWYLRFAAHCLTVTYVLSYTLDCQTRKKIWNVSNVTGLSHYSAEKTFFLFRNSKSTKNFTDKLCDIMTPLFKGSNFCGQFAPLNKRRASYHFKVYEYRNLQAFEFFHYWLNSLLNLN